MIMIYVLYLYYMVIPKVAVKRVQLLQVRIWLWGCEMYFLFLFSRRLRTQSWKAGQDYISELCFSFWVCGVICRLNLVVTVHLYWHFTFYIKPRGFTSWVRDCAFTFFTCNTTDSKLLHTLQIQGVQRRWGHGVFGGLEDSQNLDNIMSPLYSFTIFAPLYSWVRQILHPLKFAPSLLEHYCFQEMAHSWIQRGKNSKWIQRRHYVV